MWNYLCVTFSIMCICFLINLIVQKQNHVALSTVLLWVIFFFLLYCSISLLYQLLLSQFKVAQHLNIFHLPTGKGEDLFPLSCCKYFISNNCLGCRGVKDMPVWMIKNQKSIRSKSVMSNVRNLTYNVDFIHLDGSKTHTSWKPETNKSQIFCVVVSIGVGA